MAKIIEARVRQKVATLQEWQDIDLPSLDGEQLFIRSDVDNRVVSFKLGADGKKFRDLPFLDLTVKDKATPGTVFTGKPSGIYIPTNNGNYNGVTVNLADGYQVLYWDGVTLQKVVYPIDYTSVSYGGIIDDSKDLSNPTEPIWYIAKAGEYNTIPPTMLGVDSILTWNGLEWSHMPFDLEIRGDFLIADNVQEFRNMPDQVVQLLINGTYKGVTLLGYYEKGDTPAPIEYYLSNTIESDNGGSTIVIGEIKFEHLFIEGVDVRYFGVVGDGIVDDTERLNVYNNYVMNNPSLKGVSIKGTFKVTNKINFIKSVPNNLGIKDIYFDATFNSDYSSDEEMVRFENYTYGTFSGSLKVIGKGTSSYSTRQNARGVIIHNCTRIKVSNIECQFMKKDAVYLSGTSSVYELGFIRANYCGSSYGNVTGLNVNVQSFISNNGSSGSLQQYSTIKVDNIPSVLEVKSDFILINEEHYNIVGINRETLEINIFPWFNPSSITNLPTTSRYIYGAGVRNEGGDVSAGIINRLDAFVCGIGSLNRSLYPASINSGVFQGCGIGVCLGLEVTAASVGGQTMYSYYENNKADILKLTVVEIGYVFSSTTALDFSKIKQIKPRIPSGAFSASYNVLKGVSFDKNNKVFKASKDVYTNSTNTTTELNCFTIQDSVYNIRANSHTFNLVDTPNENSLFSLKAIKIYGTGTGVNNNPTGTYTIIPESTYSINNLSIGQSLILTGITSPIFIMAYLVDKKWEIVISNLTPINASVTTKGVVNQTTAQDNITQADLSNITATDLTVVQNWINTNLVPLVNAIKLSQNTELINQRNAGQQSLI